MRVYIEKTKQTINLKKSFKTSNDLLKHLKINPSTVLVIRKKEIVLNDEPISDKDDITLLSVVSGG